MKNKFWYLLLLFLLFLSCSGNIGKMKKTLKENLKLECPQYELVDFRVVDTVLQGVIEDSISMLKIENDSKRNTLKTDSLILLKFQKNQDECQQSMRTTIPYLRSSWRSLISDYERLISEKEDDIHFKLDIINRNQLKINEMDSLIAMVTDSVAYYLVEHIYNCGGSEIEENVFFNDKLEIYKIIEK